MPWKQGSVIEERLRFIVRLLDGDSMGDVCRDFRMSRKTGYKIFNRYEAEGIDALTAPYVNKAAGPVRDTADEVEKRITQGLAKIIDV